MLPLHAGIPDRHQGVCDQQVLEFQKLLGQFRRFGETDVVCHGNQLR